MISMGLMDVLVDGWMIDVLVDGWVVDVMQPKSRLKDLK